MLRQLPRDKRDAISESWLETLLATYPRDSAAMFAREKDPFANPVGHSLRVGCERILDAVLDGAGMEEVHEHLRQVIKIRAIQEFAPSKAVSFVLGLKKVLRDELKGAAEDPNLSTDILALDARIDRIALDAFDVYVECREQVHQLRINEMKRQVSWIVGKVNQQRSDPELVQISRRRSAEGVNLAREDIP